MSLGPKIYEARHLRETGASGDARFLMLSVFLVLVIALLAMFGPHGGSVFSVEQRLQQSVRTALDLKGYRAVDVTMDGQVAILDGSVATPAESRMAEAVALHAAGKGGSWSGGVVRVINHITPLRSELLGRRFAGARLASRFGVMVNFGTCPRGQRGALCSI